MASRRPSASPLAGVVATGMSLCAQALTERRLRPGRALVIGLCVGAAIGLTEAWARGHPYARMVRRTTRPNGRNSNSVALAPPMPPTSPPTLRELVRVLPIGQTRAHAGVTISLLALEAYADGFLVHSRLLLDTERPPAQTGRSQPMTDYPELVFSVSDDRNGHYRAWPQGGGDVGREWRFATRFAPALNPMASLLRLTISEVRWERIHHRRQTRNTVDMVPGNWSFALSLPDDQPAAEGEDSASTAGERR